MSLLANPPALNIAAASGDLEALKSLLASTSEPVQQLNGWYVVF
jgi:hypothetical protein